jgi:hypothetical protein
MIRQNLVIPILNTPDRVYNDPDRFYFYTPQIVRDISNKLTQRSVQQINRMLFQIKQIYYRDNVEIPHTLHI